MTQENSENRNKVHLCRSIVYCSGLVVLVVFWKGDVLTNLMTSKAVTVGMWIPSEDSQCRIGVYLLSVKRESGYCIGLSTHIWFVNGKYIFEKPGWDE